MKRKKDTADACKKKHVVDVVGKVVLITRGHMELSQDNALTAQKDLGVDIYNCLGRKLSWRSPKEAKKIIRPQTKQAKTKDEL